MTDILDQPRKRDLEAYLARAAAARREAESTTLQNVRDRCLRAEAAWLEMAARIELTDELRSQRHADRVAAEATG